MILIYALASVLLLFLGICLAILVSTAREIARRQKSFFESLWMRRSKLPLLLDSISDAPAQLRKEIIDLRARASSAAYSSEERLESERLLTTALKTLPQNSTATIFHAVKAEVEESHILIQRRLEEYNFTVDAWKKRGRFPWYKGLQTAFRVNKVPFLQPL